VIRTLIFGLDRPRSGGKGFISSFATLAAQYMCWDFCLTAAKMVFPAAQVAASAKSLLDFGYTLERRPAKYFLSFWPMSWFTATLIVTILMRNARTGPGAGWFRTITATIFYPPEDHVA